MRILSEVLSDQDWLSNYAASGAPIVEQQALFAKAQHLRDILDGEGCNCHTRCHARTG